MLPPSGRKQTDPSVWHVVQTTGLACELCLLITPPRQQEQDLHASSHC
jgi:hypothetical protein